MVNGDEGGYFEIEIEMVMDYLGVYREGSGDSVGNDSGDRKISK